MQQEKKTSRQNLFKSMHALVALAITLAPTLSHAQTRSGTLDASFGTDGKVTTTFAGPSGAGAVAIQPDGKPVAAGAAVGEGTGGVAGAGDKSRGTIANRFCGGGRGTTP